MAQRKAAATAPVKTTAKTRKASETSKLLDVVANLDAQTVIEEVGQLQNTLQVTLAGLSASISSKIEQMKNVDLAITEKEARLADLYEIEAEAMEVEAVRERRAAEEADFERSRKDRNEQWAKEQIARDEVWRKDQEEHQYAVVQRNKRATDEYNAEVAQRKRAEAVRVQDLERSWQDREDALKAREGELATLRETVAQFDARLKSEVAKAEAIVGATVKRNYEHQMELASRDSAATAKLHQSELSSLQSRYRDLETQLEQLRDQLEATRNDAKEVMTAALESASDRKASAALQKAVDAGVGTTRK